MKRLLMAAILLFSLPLAPVLVTATAHADNIQQICSTADPHNVPPTCQSTSNPGITNPLFGPGSILNKVINLLSLIVGIASVFVIMIGGVKFMTSSGDPAGVSSARNTILYAIIALLITILAQIIVRFIISRL